jgi:hypothetical protein
VPLHAHVRLASTDPRTHGCSLPLPLQGTYLTAGAARELDDFASHTALLALADRLAGEYAALLAERGAAAQKAGESGGGGRVLFSQQTLRRGELEYDDAMQVPTSAESLFELRLGRSGCGALSHRRRASWAAAGARCSRSRRCGAASSSTTTPCRCARLQKAGLG